MVDTKTNLLFTTFLKPWVHISDNVAGIVGGPQYC